MYRDCSPIGASRKQLIAICVLKLCERGVIDLDGRLEGELYTLRQLLGHTAGLADYGAISEYHEAVAANEEPWSRQKLLDLVLARGPLFAPGEAWSYSNVGYMLAREYIEAASGLSFVDLVHEMISHPLGLTTLELATSREQFSRLQCSAAGQYHPGWVYHGCLTGNVRDAARLQHGLLSGQLLGAEMLQEMLVRYPLGGAIEGRPWTGCGYGLGLMSGTMDEVGRAIGHSGGGPSCVNAIYHFPDLDTPVTVACFADGNDEGAAEFQAIRCALGD